MVRGGRERGAPGPRKELRGAFISLTGALEEEWRLSSSKQSCRGKPGTLGCALAKEKGIPFPPPPFAAEGGPR